MVLDSSEDISEAIKRYYSRQVAERTAKNLADREAREKKEENDVDFDEVKDAPAVKLVDSIIENAVRMKASDVHIEPLEKKVRVRFRVDGNLQKVLEISKETQGSLITRIKIVANLNIAEKRVPQDGRIITNIDNKEVDLRVSVLPTIHGEKIVIRILLRSSFLMRKEELGLSNYNMKILSSIMDKPYGIILVTGPTGSGKSTTVYTLLNELNTIDKNIITVEDPVEYIVEGISQVNVNTKAGLTFASGLRSMLRQDPDIIMIGEIRDNETAEIAIRAAITGHIVLSTIHTNDAPSTIARLKDMNIEPYLISTSINGIIAQRLVRKVCPHCYEIYEASDYEKEILEVDNDISLSLARAKGCPLCQDIGYKGRIGIYEIMDIGRELREGINKKKNSDELRDIAIKSGMKTLKMACTEHVLNKITTVEELLRVTFLKE
ncbi:Type II secretion system protein E [compost metagenome]